MTENVHTAIANVMRAVPYLRKQRTQGLNYTFAGEAALIRKIHDVLVENGLTIHPTKVDVIDQSSYMTAGTTPRQMFRVRVIASFRMTHGPSGTFIDIQTAGEASDTGDKAMPKALTICLKYALRQTFVIETGDDPDTEAHEAAREKSAGKTASVIQKGTVALAQCKTADDVKALAAKFATVKNETDRTELLAMADRREKQLETANA